MRILIVEDNEKLSHSLKKGLEQEGYAVDCLFDGESAQVRIEANYEDYDLIILDIMLPKRDGIQVCRDIRKQNITTPVLILTAKDTTDDKIIGLDSGADDYLVKPFSFEELLARMRALLRRPTNTLISELRIRDLTLNPATRKVYRAGKEIVLTLKEFALLEYLMINAGRIVNREQILSHVWDFNFDSFTNVVDVHIKNLRKKIDYANQEKLIETIRGLGYRLKK
jgi:DNA-binding response OmpR family regulator